MSTHKAKSTDPQLSRRDWFRLARPNQPTSTNTETRAASILGSDTNNLSTGSTARPAAELRSVSEPDRYEGTESLELPPLCEADLGPDDVRILIADISRHATDIRLIARTTQNAAADQAELLDSAVDRLLQQQLRRLQIRYTWQGQQWIDTLTETGGGIRLVRIGHPAGTC